MVSSSFIYFCDGTFLEKVGQCVLNVGERGKITAESGRVDNNLAE